jgi:hypothetical protein
MNKELKAALVWGGGMIVVALCAIFPQAGLYRQRRGHTGGHRHKWAHLCGTVGIRSDPGGEIWRDRRDRGGSSCDAWLLPFAAVQGESSRLMISGSPRQFLEMRNLAAIDVIQRFAPRVSISG